MTAIPIAVVWIGYAGSMLFTYALGILTLTALVEGVVVIALGAALAVGIFSLPFALYWLIVFLIIAVVTIPFWIIPLIFLIILLAITLVFASPFIAIGLVFFAIGAAFFSIIALFVFAGFEMVFGSMVVVAAGAVLFGFWITYMMAVFTGNTDLTTEMEGWFGA